MEPSMKILAMKQKLTEYDRAKVCTCLHDSSTSWIKEREEVQTNGEHGFIAVLVDCIMMKFEHTNAADDIRIRPEEVLEYFGEEKSEKLAQQLQQQHTRDTGKKCIKTTLTFIKEAIITAINNTNNSHLVYKKRKGNARTEFAFFSRTLFVKNTK
jgi:hypothetical protein